MQTPPPTRPIMPPLTDADSKPNPGSVLPDPTPIRLSDRARALLLMLTAPTDGRAA